VSVTLEDHLARMQVDPDKMPLQRVTAVIAGKSGKYTPRLLLKIEDPANFTKLKSALESLKGVRYVRDPNDKGLSLIDLRKEEKTTLRDIYQAAEGVQVKIADAPRADKISKG
jgi:hypothetical protein